MRYRPVAERSRAEIEAMFRSAETTDVLDALLSAAYYDPDWRWVQGRCLEFLDSSDVNLRSLSATCLGHLARIHRQLDLEIVLPKLMALRDTPQIGPYVQDTLDDIQFFIKFQ